MVTTIMMFSGKGAEKNAVTNLLPNIISNSGGDENID